MRGGYQPVRFPGNLDKDAVLQELERLEFSPARLPLSETNLRKFSRLLHAPILELDRIATRVEHDPLLTVGVLRLVADELAGVDSIRISDCIVIAGRIRLLALAASANSAPVGIPAIDDFTERSRIFSLIASRVAASASTVDPAAARLAGLLHALGELPILLSGGTTDRYSPATIADWGKRLAASWHLPAALVSAVAAYDTRGCDSSPDPMRLIIGATRRLVNCQVVDGARSAVLSIDGGKRTSKAVKCQRLS